MKKRIFIISLSLAVLINMTLLIPGFSQPASAKTIGLRVTVVGWVTCYPCVFLRLVSIVRNKLRTLREANDL